MNMTGFTGNARIAEMLQGSLGHAYLISGPEQAECRALADIIAGALVCQSTGARPCNACLHCEKAKRNIHPDIAVVRREDKKEIPVAAIRQIVHDAPTLPNEAEHKVYIVEEADALNQSAQNAFLKILEEPPRFVTFLLLAENPLSLLPTVCSRCVHLSLVPEVHTSSEDDDEIADMAEIFYKAYQIGGLELLHFCVDLEKTDRQVLEGFIEAAYAKFAEDLGRGHTDKHTLQAGLTLFDSLRDDLRFNVSAGHIAGKILATRL